MLPEYQTHEFYDGEKLIIEYICERCGGTRVLGDWPNCKGNPLDHASGKFGEEPLVPYLDHNITKEFEGVEITTRGQRRQIMRENGLEYRKNRFEGIGRKSYIDLGRG